MVVAAGVRDLGKGKQKMSIRLHIPEIGFVRLITRPYYELCSETFFDSEQFVKISLRELQERERGIENLPDAHNATGNISRKNCGSPIKTVTTGYNSN